MQNTRKAAYEIYLNEIMKVLHKTQCCHIFLVVLL